MAIGKRVLTLLLACAPVLFSLGCSDFGQGRSGAGDRIRQSTRTGHGDSRLGSYRQTNRSMTCCRPFTVKIPADPDEMGPTPAAGKRLLFDPNSKKIVFFDTAAGTIKTVTYTPLMEAANVDKDDPRVKGIKFPVIDRQNKAITIYSSRDKKLVKFTLADEYFALPDDTWQAGDDVRYYFKQPGQALRMMNVTATDVMKG